MNYIYHNGKYKSTKFINKYITTDVLIKKVVVD